jgi:hypothetical protein
MDNKILTVLVDIKETYGDGIFYNPSMIKNLLSDLAPGLKKERVQIANFLESNKYFQLKHAGKDYPLTRKRLIEEYIDTFAVDEQTAVWVINLFSVLMGYGIKTQKYEYARQPESPTKLLKENQHELLPLTTPVKNNPVYIISQNIKTAYENVSRIAADAHSLAVTQDGHVLATGTNEDGQCNTWWWKDIISVAAGTHFSVGLKKDGTVLAAGRNDYGQCGVKHWTDIKQISAGTRHTVGLRSDGTVVAAGENGNGECNVSKWRYIMHVSAGCRCTFGIKKDGHVLVSGNVAHDDLYVSHLQNVADIAHPMTGRAVALLKRGIIERVGREDKMRKNFSHWKNLCQISAAPDYFAGLFNGGKVRLLAYFWPDTGIECAPNDWQDIQAIAAGRYHILGLQKDGRVVAAMLHPNPKHDRGQCNVSEWRL